jgi:MoxR-like ATPase
MIEFNYKFLAVNSEHQAAALQLRPMISKDYSDPRRYQPVAGLCEAIDAAMLLGIPLLLTGEPGSGKTQAARWLAHFLKVRLLRQDIKSTTMGRDLLYTFDDVARFRDAAGKKTKPLIDYITFSALGEAIIRAIGGNVPLQPLRQDTPIPETAFGTTTGLTFSMLLPKATGFATATPEHCVVLIDELDKAPSDTPNDLLAEIENMAFDIPELAVRIEGNTGWRPIVIITSNSERSLPPAFLRRCAFFDIPPPDRDRTAQIVENSIPNVKADSALFLTAWSYYATLRKHKDIRKPPATSEFLSWIGCLVDQMKLRPSDPIEPGKTIAKRVAPTLVCMAKSEDDFRIAKRLLESLPDISN